LPSSARYPEIDQDDAVDFRLVIDDEITRVDIAVNPALGVEVICAVARSGDDGERSLCRDDDGSVGHCAPQIASWKEFKCRVRATIDVSGFVCVDDVLMFGQTGRYLLLDRKLGPRHLVAKQMRVKALDRGEMATASFGAPHLRKPAHSEQRV
jgi:hypothetical protein